jgi:hypothetical protein
LEKMSEQDWIPCGEKFITGDVIRWTEAIWPETRRKRKKKVMPLGEHRATAEVLELDSRDYVRLSVIKDEIVKNPHGMPLKLLKKGEIIAKKRETIARGKAERLKWTDEAVRAIEVSKFLS